MPDCWLVISLHSEGPATCQLDQGSPWSSSVLEQVGTHISCCTACFKCRPPPCVTIQLCPDSALPTLTCKFRPYAVKPLFQLFPLLITKSISPLPNPLPYLNRTLTSRTSGCSTETNKAKGTFFSPPQNVVCLATLIFTSSSVSLLNLRELSNYSFNVKWVPCHQGVTPSQVADGGAGLQVWRVAADKPSRQAIADSRQGVILHLGSWSGTYTLVTVKISPGYYER